MPWGAPLLLTLLPAKLLLLLLGRCCCRPGAASPGYDVYRTVGHQGNFASGYSYSRHKRWSAVYLELKEGWHKPLPAPGRVVAVMTTTPRRIAGMQLVVDSMLRQSYRPDVLYVFVPRVFKRDGAEYIVPPWLQQYHDDGLVTVVRCEDAGPGTDVMTVLEMETDPLTFIFKGDDDQVYGNETLKLLLRSSLEIFPGRAITVDTTQWYTHMGGVILQGVHGMIFQRGFFDDSIFDYRGAAGNLSKFCWLHDDLWYSAHFAKKGIRREALELRGGMEFFLGAGTRVLETAWASNALFQGGAGTDNYQNLHLCNAALLERAPHLWDSRQRVVVVLVVEDAMDQKRLLEGTMSQVMLPHAVYAFGWKGQSLRLGSWMDAVVLTPLNRRRCDNCNPQGMLMAVRELESDPETVMIATTVNEIFSTDKLVQYFTKCACRKSITDVIQDRCILSDTTSLRRGGLNEGRILYNIFQPFFDDPLPAGELPPTHWIFPEHGILGVPAAPDFLRQAIHAYAGDQTPPVVAVLRVPAQDRPWANVAVGSLLLGTMTPHRLYVMMETLAGEAQRPSAESDDERVEVLWLPPGEGVVGDLRTVRRKVGPQAFILHVGVREYAPQFLHQVLGTAANEWGYAVGFDGVIYADIGPILLGPVLYPPGSVDGEIPGEPTVAAAGDGSKVGEAKEEDASAAVPRCGMAAESLWRGVHLAARGVPTVTVDNELSTKLMTTILGSSCATQDITPPDEAAWEACLTRVLWPSLGRRLQNPNPQPRVILFVQPVPVHLFNAVPEEARPAFQRHMRDTDLWYLRHQERPPSVVYVHEVRPHVDGAMDGTPATWVGGPSGFEVRPIPCGTPCSSAEAVRTALSMELRPDALFIFAAAERLVNDQLVMENFRCYQRTMMVPEGRKRCCGYMPGPGGGRLREVALLRDAVMGRSEG